MARHRSTSIATGTSTPGTLTDAKLKVKHRLLSGTVRRQRPRTGCIDRTVSLSRSPPPPGCYTATPNSNSASSYLSLVRTPTPAYGGKSHSIDGLREFSRASSTESCSGPLSRPMPRRRSPMSAALEGRNGGRHRGRRSGRGVGSRAREVPGRGRYERRHLGRRRRCGFCAGTRTERPRPRRPWPRR